MSRKKRKKEPLNGFKGILVFIAFAMIFMTCCGFITFLAYIISKLF
jgi:hypothetical protein